MNEKIKELIKQATTEEHGVIQPFRVSTVYHFDKEKFAELIVLECANLTLSYKTHDHYMGWVDHGEAIVEHFGVKR